MLTAQQATARLADLRTRNGKLTAEAVVHIAECQRLSQEFERVQSSIHQRDTEVSSSQDGAEDSEKRRYKKLVAQVVVVVSHQSPCHRSRAGERHSFKPQSDVEQVRRQWSSHRQGAAGAVCCLAPTIWIVDLFMMVVIRCAIQSGASDSASQNAYLDMLQTLSCRHSCRR